MRNLKSSKPNRARLRELIERAGITQKEAAELIAKKACRPVSERTLRSWLTAPDNASSRTSSAGWAAIMLEQALVERGEKRKTGKVKKKSR